VRQAVTDELKDLQDRGILERIDASPWVSPIVWTQRKEGVKLHMFVDLREPKKAVISHSSCTIVFSVHAEFHLASLRLWHLKKWSQWYWQAYWDYRPTLMMWNAFGMSAKTLTNLYRCTIESILSGCITAWFAAAPLLITRPSRGWWRQRSASSSAPSPSRAKHLPHTCLKKCLKKAWEIIEDYSHPGHGLFTLLPSGRCFRSIQASPDHQASQPATPIALIILITLYVHL